MMKRSILITSLLLAAAAFDEAGGADVFYPARYWPNAPLLELGSPIPLEAGEIRDDLVISLEDRSGGLRGVVRRDDGFPLDLVLVVAEKGRFRSSIPSGTGGLVFLDGMTPGNYKVRAWTFDPRSNHRNMMPYFAPSVRNAADAEVFTVEELTQLPGLELVLSSGASITGTVLGGDSGLGVGNLLVEAILQDAADPLVYSDRTDGTGSFEIGGLVPGDYLLVARGGYSVYIDLYYNDALDQGDADLIALTSPADAFDVDLRPDRQGRIFGEVRSEAGNGFPGLEVIATEQSSRFQRTAVSDDEAFYVLDKLRQGDYKIFVPALGKYYLDATNENDARIVQIVPGANVFDIDVEGLLETQCVDPRIFGTIRGRIDIRSEDPVPGEGWTIRAQAGAVVREIRVSDPGGYRLECLPDGDYVVSIHADSTYAVQYYPQVAYSELASLVTVAAGDSADAIDFEPARGAVLAGVVRDQKDVTPVRSAPVVVQLEELDLVLHTTTDIQGRFRVGRLPDGSGLPEGTYKVGVDSFSTAQILPVPVRALDASTELIRERNGWKVRVSARLPFDAGPFVVDLLRRDGAGDARVIDSTRPEGTGGTADLEDPSPPPGHLLYRLQAVADRDTLLSPWLDVTVPADPPPPLARLLAGPNPGRETWRLSLSLDRPLETSLAIYSLQGRLVWRDGRSAADGKRPYAWDGFDLDGQPAAAGVYFYVLAGTDPQGPSEGEDLLLGSGRFVWVR